MLRRKERARNRLESRKPSKTSDPPKTIQINDSDKTQNHKSRPETVDLSNEDMDTDNSNKPLTTNNIYTPSESQIGINMASVES